MASLYEQPSPPHACTAVPASVPPAGKLEVAKKSSPAFVTSELRAGRGGPLQLHPHLHQATPAGSDPDAGHAEHYRRCGDACVRGIAEFYSEDLDFFRFPHLQAAAEATAAAEQQA